MHLRRDKPQTVEIKELVGVNDGDRHDGAFRPDSRLKGSRLEFLQMISVEVISALSEQDALNPSC